MITDNTAEKIEPLELETAEIETDVEETISPKEEKTFSPLGVSQAITNTLLKSKISIPTPIQERAIPLALEGKDVVGIAQTGTGKTLAFAIPMLQNLLENKNKGLVLVPTRELALQVSETFDMLTKSGLNVEMRNAVLIGGASMSMQIQKLQRKPRIIIATPGRLADHMQRKTISLHDVSILVLDEADRMFDMGFAPQIKRVLEVTPKTRQTMLFSATMPPEIQAIANKHLVDPKKIEITPPGQSVKEITQKVCYVTNDSKFEILDTLLKNEPGLTLVFAKTKHGVKNLTRKIHTAGHRAEEIHSNRSMFQRKKALDGFKAGKYAVLVATDVAARGIDVEDVRLVVNYDLPQSPEDYVHRIGRTGRAGRTGTSITFATNGESFRVKQIERLTKVEMVLSELSLAKPAGRGGEREDSYSRQNRRPSSSRSRRPSFGGDRAERSSSGYRGSSDRSSNSRSSNSTERAPRSQSEERSFDRPRTERSENYRGNDRSRSDRSAGDRSSSESGASERNSGERSSGERNTARSFQPRERSSERSGGQDRRPRAGSANTSGSYQPRDRSNGEKNYGARDSRPQSGEFRPKRRSDNDSRPASNFRDRNSDSRQPGTEKNEYRSPSDSTRAASSSDRPSSGGYGAQRSNEGGRAKRPFKPNTRGGFKPRGGGRSGGFAGRSE